jgi:hypothetical protein
MSREERQRLARALAAIESLHPELDRRQRVRRLMGLVLMLGICLFLGAWIAILALTLPLHFTIHHWRGAWVGLDIGELAGFAATMWAAWRQRQVVILCMVFTGTLLICDAWFDVVLDYGTPDVRMSILAALFAEIPLAVLLFTAARRLVRISVAVVMRLEGVPGPVPPLRKVPLFAAGLVEVLPARVLATADADTSPPRGNER